MRAMNELSRPYDGLTPETVLDAVESTGLLCDGRQLALNSFENRVYQVGVEDASPVVAKFYRPGRWTDAAIIEEHRFGLALANAEIPVVPPTPFGDQTLLYFGDFRFAVFRRQGGREPQLESEDNLEWLGRVLARIHNVGASLQFQHRQSLLDFDRVQAASAFVFEGDFVPFELKARYKQVADAVLSQIQQSIAGADSIHTLPIHGDCHRGNVLWTDDGPHFVDLDDCCIGPTVADFWMLLDGDQQRRQHQLEALLTGYEQFRDFDWRELQLIESLRAMRMIEYAAWIARRWDDPAFPLHFGWFGQPRYWEEHIQGLGEQLERMSD